MMSAPPDWLTDVSTGPEALIREARRRRRRRWLAAVVAIAVVAGGAAAVIAESSGGRPRPPGSPGLPSPAHGLPAAAAHNTAAVTVSEASLPKGNSLSLAAGYGAVWVTGVGVTYEVNEVSGRIVRTIPTPGTFPDGCRSGIAAGAGAVWVTHSCRGIYRINPHTGRVTASLRVPDVGNAIAVAAGLVWVTNYHGDMLRIQPRTNQIIGKPLWVGYGDWDITPGPGTLWVTSYGSGSYPGEVVSRVDLATGAVERLGNGTGTVQAVGAGSLWTTDPVTGVVERIDPATGKVGASIFVVASQVEFWKGSAWALTLQRGFSFVRIDPETNRVTGKAVPVGKPVPAGWNTDPTAITAGPTGLWVLDFMRNLLFHLVMRPARP